MQTPKTIKLILAAAMVFALVAILGITMNTGRTAPKTPITRKLLRRHDKTKGPPTAAEVAELKRQEQRNDRELEDGIPKHLPIRVKIKTEKQEGFKDLENGRWLRDLEIEVTNLGPKPIYFLDLRLMLPDTKGPDGNIIGWVLLYGRTDLVSVTEPLKVTDVPIQPKESHIFKIADRFVSAWEDLVREGLVAQPKRVQVLFQLVNFGDGTGYWGGSAAPLPHPKKPLAAGPCVDAFYVLRRRADVELCG